VTAALWIGALLERKVQEEATTVVPDRMTIGQLHHHQLINPLIQGAPAGVTAYHHDLHHLAPTLKHPDMDHQVIEIETVIVGTEIVDRQLTSTYPATVKVKEHGLTTTAAHATQTIALDAVLKTRAILGKDIGSEMTGRIVVVGAIATERESHLVILGTLGATEETAEHDLGVLIGGTTEIGTAIGTGTSTDAEPDQSDPTIELEK
jgi:hypothetical protein